MLPSTKSFLKSTVIYGLVGSFRSFMEFLLLPLYSRYLGPSDFGVLDVLMIFIMVGGVACMMELYNAVFRFYFDEPAEEFRRKIISTAVFFMTLNAAFLLAVTGILARNFAGAVFQMPGAAELFVWAAAHVFLNSILTIPVNFLRIDNRPARYTTICLVQVALSLAGICLFVIGLRWGVKGILVAKVLAMIPSIAVCGWWARHYLGFWIDLPLLRRMLKFSLPLVPAGAAIWAINSLNRLVMLHYLTLNEIGLFSIGSKFVVIITIAVIAFQLAWPHFAFSNMNTTNSSRIFGQVFDVFVAGGIWLVLFLVLFSGAFIEYAMSPAFEPATRVVLPLAVGMFLYGIFYFLTTGDIINKTTSKILPSVAAGVALNLGLNMIVTPRYGFVGTAWVTTCSYFVMAATMWALMPNASPARDGIRWSKLGRAAFPAAILLVFGWRLASANDPATLGIKGLLFLSYPLLLVVSGFISRDHVRMTAAKFAGVKQPGAKMAGTAEQSNDNKICRLKSAQRGYQDKSKRNYGMSETIK